jgi:hypothetical protein
MRTSLGANPAPCLRPARTSSPSLSRRQLAASDVPTFEWRALFQRDWEALTATQQTAFRDAVATFVADLNAGGGFRKGLRVKKMQGREDIWELTWAPDGRATFHFGESVRPGELHIVWRRIGTHKIFTRP